MAFSSLQIQKTTHEKVKRISQATGVSMSSIGNISINDFINSGRAAALERVTRSLADDSELRKTYLAHLRSLEPDELEPSPEDIIGEYL